jgi:hypothetical protein
MSQTSSCYQQKIISRQIFDVFCVQNGASLLTKQYCIQSKAYRRSNFFSVSNRKHPKQSKASQPAHMYAGHVRAGKKGYVMSEHVSPMATCGLGSKVKS